MALTKPQIRITSLQIAMQNAPQKEYNHLVGRQTTPISYDVISEAKRIEKYINTGK